MMKNNLSSEERHSALSMISDKQWAFNVPQEIEKMSDGEKMTIIRSRKRQNQEKVRKFFGSDLKIDVSLSMIKRFKLPAILESDLPLTYFICFLIKYQGIENLFFCLEVEKFLDTKFDNFESKKAFAQRIFNTFMENGLPMQINTNSQNIESVREQLKSAKQCEDLDTLFTIAYTDIYSMLTNVYADFEKNDYYIHMISDLTTAEAEKQQDSLSIESGSSCSGGSIYPMKAYYSALDSITYTVGNMEKIYDDHMTTKRMSVNRHRIIRRMIVGFCESRLKMDFPESSMTMRQSLLTDPDSEPINPRSSIISNLSALSNCSQSNSTCSIVGKRKDELDMF